MPTAGPQTEASTVVIKAKGVPVFYLPALYYPIQKDDRATGILAAEAERGMRDVAARDDPLDEGQEGAVGGVEQMVALVEDDALQGRRLAVLLLAAGQAGPVEGASGSSFTASGSG